MLQANTRRVDGARPLHSILLDVLHERFGVDDGALKWFKPYLRGRTNVYSTESGISLPVALGHGVPQGSVMGPMEFIAYTEENVENIDNRTINHHLYADDIQLLAKMQIANMLPIKSELEKQCQNNIVVAHPDDCV